jgi:hypothetical protein
VVLRLLRGESWRLLESGQQPVVRLRDRRRCRLLLLLLRLVRLMANGEGRECRSSRPTRHCLLLLLLPLLLRRKQVWRGRRRHQLLPRRRQRVLRPGTAQARRHDTGCRGSTLKASTTNVLQPHHWL